MTIEQLSYWVGVLSLGAVVASWGLFAYPLVQRSRMNTSGNRTREPLSWLGLALQLLGYPVSWLGWRSPMFSPIVGDNLANMVLQVIAIVLAVSSAWFALEAIRELGKQWSLQARVLEDHKLVTSGVYGVVRHPIYTAMFGMLLATGLAISNFMPLAVGLLVFLAGTMVRIRLEEGLLKSAFGKEFLEWSSKVAALIPFLRR
jgi:protein-S-isoprenylcysteine O-methyltransferase Ste14